MKFHYIFIFLISLLPLDSVAQSYYFSHYQVEEGLSNNSVTCSLQDRNGFMWFGTKDGLNRFDGYSYKIFRNNPSKANSLGSNFIFSLYQDLDGVLWVGTERGVYYYNYKKECFTFLKGSPKDNIRCILMDNQYNIWIISGLKLYKYTPRSNKITTYSNSFNATSICQSSFGDIWVSSTDGYLNKYDPRTGRFASYPLFSHSKAVTSNWIEKIFFGGNGKIFIGTSNQGVKVFDTRSYSYLDILTNNSDGTPIFARDFIRSTTGELWIATESGIFIYNETKKSLNCLQKQYNNPYSLSDNAVYTLCKDNEGGIWAGTYFGGLNYFPRQYAYFEKFFPRTGENAISGNAVREICKDHRDNLWIGTEDAGLNKLSLATGKFKNYKPGDGRSGISATNIHGLMVYGDELWIGTFEHGLDIMDLKTEKVIRHYNASDHAGHFKSNFIYCMLKTSSEKILVGTAAGLYRYNKSENNFTLISQVPANAFYTTLTEDHQGNIWAGTFRDGVYRVNLANGYGMPINKYPAQNIDLAANRVSCVMEDSNHIIWIATESGLFKYNPRSKNIKELSIKNGFPVNLIYSLQEDGNGSIWISTSKGLLSLDSHTEKVTLYTKSNGLLNDQFNYNSAFKDNQGKMYFGSVKGMISFKPDKFVTNTYKPPVYITGFQVSNAELEINQNGSPLDKSILFTKKVVLDYDQSSFSIDFAALSYTSPSTTAYAYKMDGLYDRWTYISANPKAYYTGLAPGKYVFKVKAANSSGVWNNKLTSLHITIRPPYWKSSWAYVIYSLLVISSAVGIIINYHRRLVFKNNRKMELFENEKEKEIYQAKIEFFTTVAHEIRTPLTLIKGPMEKLIKRANELPDMEKNLRIMNKNTQRLLSLASQLLDFRKTETKGYSLNFVNVNVNELLEEIWVGFQTVAENKQICYRLIMPPEAIFAYIDPEAFTKINSNLIDNALKYGQSAVAVMLSAGEGVNGVFNIQFSSDGKAIASEYREQIFEPFFRTEDSKDLAGTGIGLSIARALVELHNGRLELVESKKGFNLFEITLPIHQKIEFNLDGKWKK